MRLLQLHAARDTGAMAVPLFNPLLAVPLEGPSRNRQGPVDLNRCMPYSGGGRSGACFVAAWVAGPSSGRQWRRIPLDGWHASALGVLGGLGARISPETVDAF